MRIKVCAGIGDNIWLIQKLLNSGDSFDFVIANDQPRRGKQIFDMIPQIVNSSSYGNFTSSHVIRGHQHKDLLFSQIKDYSFIQCNTHLESGHRIESFLPDLETTFFPDWKIDNHFEEEGEYIGIYGSCYAVLRHWNFWKEREWMQLIDKIHTNFPQYKFAVIGASFDLDLASKICLAMEQRGIPFISVVGRPLDYVASLMKRLKFFYSFPSGLGILAHSLKCPTMMFYPDHLNNMKRTWVSLEAMSNGWFMEESFINPFLAFEKTKFSL